MAVHVTEGGAEDLGQAHGQAGEAAQLGVLTLQVGQRVKGRGKASPVRLVNGHDRRLGCKMVNLFLTFFE